MPVGNVRVSVKFGEAGAAANDVTRPPRSWQERRPDQKLGVQPSEKQPGFGWAASSNELVAFCPLGAGDAGVTTQFARACPLARLRLRLRQSFPP